MASAVEQWAASAVRALRGKFVREGAMTRKAKLLAASAAFVATLTMGLAAAPAEARHFAHFGFGFGYPIYYAPPPVYPVYYPPPVVYHYGYGYRARHYYRRVAHRHWCGCHCCR
jgi:hypothetical protein